jgi:hypothetical protein
MTRLLCLLSLWTNICVAASGLESAQRRYLLRDYRGMLSEVADELRRHPDDEFANQNLLEMTERAFAEASPQGIALGWHLPPEISELLINERKFETGRKIFFQLQAAGRSAFGAIRQLKITRVPGRVLIDRKAKIGRWNEFRHNLHDADYRFLYFSPEFPEPIGGGLFDIEIGLSDGRKVSGSFVMSGPSPGYAPKILSPKPNEALSTRTPTFRWENWASFPYFPFETRRCSLRVIPDENQATRWSIVFEDRSPAKRLRHPPVRAVAGRELDLGNYLSYLRCDAIRREGDLLLSRETITYAPFRITLP